MNAPQIGIGSRVRKSPYFDATLRHGAKAFSVYNHMYMPLFYQDPVADYWKLINDVTLWDVACQRQVEITGPDAAKFTQYLTSRNLDNLAVGQAKYVCLTDENGGMINDPVLLRVAEDRFWLSTSDTDVRLWALGVANGSALEVEISEPDVSPVQVQGPKSTEVMKSLFGDWVDELKYYWFREAHLGDAPVIVSRTGWSGEKGYEIFLRDGRFGDELWEAVMKAGEPHGIAPAGPSAIRRLEAGILSHGSDMTLAENPFEIGLGWLVDVEQDSDFVGKEALRRIKEKGVSRRLVGFELTGDPLAQPNEHRWPVMRGGAKVGEVTSAVYSPRLERNIGLALVGVEHAELGTVLDVEMPGQARTANVVETPFFDPGKALPRGASTSR